jgi:hypothetical protein
MKMKIGICVLTLARNDYYNRFNRKVGEAEEMKNLSRQLSVTVWSG